MRDSIMVAGVDLDQYASMLAARDDALPEADALRIAAIDAPTWVRAEPAWSECILDDLARGGTLGEELSAAMDVARARWKRPLPPLDEDLRAYLDFDRAYADEPDGIAFLASRAMTVADMARLDALWRGRLASDPALRARALALLADPPRELVEPAPRPASISEGER